MSSETATRWSLEAGPPDWLVLPSEPANANEPANASDLATWRDDVTLVFAAILAVDEQLGTDPECIRPGAPLDIDAALDSLLEFAAALPPEQRLVAGLAVPGRWPLPVIVNVTRAGDDPQDLLEAAGARGGFAATPTVADDILVDLEDGFRVTRFDLDDDGVIWATVSCARRSNGADTILTWSTSDLELVTHFTPHLDCLLGLVRIEGAA